MKIKDCGSTTPFVALFKGGWWHKDCFDVCLTCDPIRYDIWNGDLPTTVSMKIKIDKSGEKICIVFRLIESKFNSRLCQMIDALCVLWNKVVALIIIIVCRWEREPMSGH